MDYLTFCLTYNYNQRSDSARESYVAFKMFFNTITSQKTNAKLLSFLGLNNYGVAMQRSGNPS
jgi:hypothetical protein